MLARLTVTFFLAALVVIVIASRLYLTVPVLGHAAPTLKSVEKIVLKKLPQTSPDELLQKIELKRNSKNLAPLINLTTLCTENSEAVSNCSYCTHAAVVSISKIGTPELVSANLFIDPNANALFVDSATKYICVKENDHNLFVYIAKEASPVRSLEKQPKKPTQSTDLPKTAINFTEEQLWNALVDYRHAHKKPDLLKDENLCVYARKRVQDHQKLLETRTPPEQYKNPDKYPLDSHAGFMKDAESGYAFKIAQKREVAENLAYWPTAQFPHQVIEWGWDTSTEGHREAQLSSDYTHACISGKDSFFVAIFGR